MQLIRGSLLAGAQSARGTTVVIDVFRAFTCTPLLFSLGIKQSILVSMPEDAFALKKDSPELILSGEISGVPIAGFDFGNSPSEILKQDKSFFQGKTVVQRTSSGVQGALAALDRSDEVLIGSYALARSVAGYILSKAPKQISLVAMGWDLMEIAPEDEWCAAYIAHLLGMGSYDHIQALREIIFHKQAQKFLRSEKPHFPPEDVVLCIQRDIYDFVLRVQRKSGRVVVDKIDPCFVPDSPS
jgi:2-phosphosulfolactate phosphatase